ncbi:hypothetical protein [Pseudoduganella plicata]|uniref:hypothetical protein n=1 Tax=Pseudoduganella plicata TaxID=321984 RepID=UPI00141BC950|nr:hypothetical protein [Pseudoduganella plicata]
MTDDPICPDYRHLASCPLGADAAAAPAANAPFNTQLFNLLENKKNIVDGKHYYRKDFAQAFDALLASSKLSRVDENKVSLKKRLLSGPAGEPDAVTEAGKQYLYYRACQAHMCDETNLGLVYEPASGKMAASLRLNGQQEYLGTPTPAERALLERMQAQR